MAGAAIGVSHLVQSTRAGADYGFQLLALVVLINVFKYPFFEFGHRYAVAAGESLLHGYLRMGRGYLLIFLILNFITAVGAIAGVTFVTAALAQNFFGFGLSGTLWSAILMSLCAALIIFGRYDWLDSSMKIIMALLVVTTVSAFFVALKHGTNAAPNFAGAAPVSAAFLIALMGWMPAPVEVSVWQSLWVGAKDESDHRRMSWREAKLDFNFSYILAAVLAVVFLSLGALTMHGTGLEFSDNGAKFAEQIVNIYRQTFGNWVVPIISLAAFATMFSTTLTVIDGYPRSLAVAAKLVAPHIPFKDATHHWLWIGLGCVLSMVVIWFFPTSLKGLIDVVTAIAFLTGPYFSYINYRLVISDAVPPEMQPGRAMRVLSCIALVFFVGFSLYYLWTLIALRFA